MRWRAADGGIWLLGLLTVPEPKGTNDRQIVREGLWEAPITSDIKLLQLYKKVRK
jgi:hypothetical protein